MYIWVKLAPNLALTPTGPNFESLPSCSHALPPSLSLLTSVLSNGLMDYAYIKATTRLRDKMASHLLRSQISYRNIYLISKPQLWRRLQGSSSEDHALSSSHLVEFVPFQEFAEQICRKYLILQPLLAILPIALCDDLVQRRGADFLHNRPLEPNVPGFLAGKAKPQAQLAISVIYALFEAFPDCILLFIPHSFGWVMTFIEV